MGRSRASAKKAGTMFETAIAKYFKDAIGSDVVRMPKSGALDKGDIYGVKISGKMIAVECKNPGKNSPKSISQWWSETINESQNIGTGLGILIVSSYGKSLGESIVIIDEGMFSMLSSISDIADKKSMLVKSKGFDSWVKSDYIDEFRLISPRKGVKDGFWHVVTLDNFVEFLDKEVEELPKEESRAEVILSELDLKRLMRYSVVKSIDSLGREVYIQLDMIQGNNGPSSHVLEFTESE